MEDVVITNHTCSKCGSWKVGLIGDRSNNEYYICYDCDSLLEHIDPKEGGGERTAVVDLITKTLAHEAETRIIHRRNLSPISSNTLHTK